MTDENSNITYVPILLCQVASLVVYFSLETSTRDVEILKHVQIFITYYLLCHILVYFVSTNVYEAIRY